jgi:hypothetical protein
MNFVENLKSTQLKKLLKIFKSSGMESFNIFGPSEGFLYEFANLSGVWKFENVFNQARPTCQRPVSVLTARDGRLIPHAVSARYRWPPVVAAPRGLAPFIPALVITEEAATHCAFPLPSFGRAPRCSAPHWPPLHPPSPIVDEPPASCPTGPKGVPHRRAPLAPRACPERLLAKLGNGIVPLSSSSVSSK